MSAGLHTVHVRVNDAATGQPIPCRVQFTGPDGRYYAPFGRLTEFATVLDLDVGGNLRLGSQRYAYIDGACEIGLPAGPITVSVTRGPEYSRLRQVVELKPGQLSLRLCLKRWTDARADGWYSGDVDIRCAPPHAVLLEAAGEDVAVANLLAGAIRKRGDHGQTYLGFDNILAFSGQRPALECPGHLVVVNTRNYHRELGSLALLNCHRIVFPLTFGQPDGADDWTLADWCDQCHRKGGLVIAGGYKYGASESLADTILGKVDALQMTGFEHPDELYPPLEDWYQLLGAGFRLPLAGSGRKGSNESVIGSTRTYARLQPGEEFTYKNWIEAVRAGRTFVTNGPLIFLRVNERGPGGVVDLREPSDAVRGRVEVCGLAPFKRVELVANGAVVASAEATGSPATARLEAELSLPKGGWLAARCWGTEQTETGQWVGAQTSPVYVQVAGQPAAPDPAALAALTARLDKMLAWVANEARCPTDKHRAALADVFTAARAELQRRAIP
jgi:hypothetical protein